MKNITPFFLLLQIFFLTQDAVAQTDNLRMKILSQKDPQVELVMKGRSLVLENYISGDKQKTKEVLTYLVNQEDSFEVFPFYSGEKMLLYYWLDEHQKTLDILSGRDTFLYKKIDPPRDGVTQKLVEYARLRRDSIRTQIDKILIIDLQTKAFLKLKYDDLIYGDSFRITLDSINKEADEFLQKYPDSRYENYIRYNIREVYKQSNWGFGFEFFSGYGILTKQLSEHYTNIIPFGVAFDVYYKNVCLYIRDYLGYTQARKTIPFSNGTWHQGEGALTFVPEAALGYVMLDNTSIKLAPFVGIAGMNITRRSSDDGKEDETIGLEFTTTYTAGICFDWKLKSKTKSKHPIPSEYSFIRFRYSYNTPQFDKKYTGFDGVLHSFTIGFSGFSRQYRRSF